MKPLNPIMAVLVIASVGALPLRTLANDGETPAKAVATTDDKNPVNALAKLLARNPAARKDAGKRAADFLLEPDASGKSFVASGVDAKGLGAVAQAWGETNAGVGSVAMLYFVAGPGPSVPAWAEKDPILAKTFVPGMKWEQRLRKALEDWADKAKSQITPAQEKTQATAFLNDAAEKAASVFSDPRTKEEIDLSVKANDTTAVVTPDTRGAGRRTQFDGSTRQYTLDDLYGPPAAVVKNVAGPKDENSRTISMKIYTKRMPDGTTRNEIGIFDITNTNDIYGQRFPIDSGDQSFALDDRTEGHKKYELKFGTADKSGNRTIKFARPDGGPALETTVSDLFLKRADQAATMGNIVKIGDEEFYAIPQGGAKSALALFSKSAIDGRGTGDPRDLIPSLFAEVGVRGSDGRNENVPPGDKGGPHLGKTADGKEYHLEFNKQAGAWEVKPGPGNLPVAPKPAGSGTGTGTGAGTDTTGGGDTGTTNPNGGMSAEDVIARLFQETPGCKKEDYSKLAPALQGKYGLVACTDPREGVQEILIVPITPETTGGQMKYTSVEGYQLLKGRLFDHYLILSFDKQVQYLDILKKETNGFALSGLIDAANKGASKFSDVNAFVDAMVNYMGVSASDPAVAEIPKRVAAQMGTKPYYITGGLPDGKLVVNAVSGGVSTMVWPNVMKPGELPPAAANQYANLGGGAANAMDAAGTISSAEQQFPAVLELGESRRATPMAGHAASADAAVYESVDSPKKYFLEIKYYAMDPKDPQKPDGEKEKKIFHQKFFEVFNSSNPLPSSFQVQGLTTAGAVVNKSTAAGYRFIKGTTKEKGVLAMFQNKQVSEDNQRDKAANCVGPLIWWGVADRDAAQKICLDDKL